MLISPASRDIPLGLGLVLLAVGLVCCFFNPFSPAIPAPLSWIFPGIIPLAMGTAFSALVLAQEALHVGPGKIQKDYRLLGQTFRIKTLASDRIKDVFIMKDATNTRSWVRIVGESGTIDADQGATHEELLWLRRFLLSRLVH